MSWPGYVPAAVRFAAREKHFSCATSQVEQCHYLGFCIK